MYTYCLGFFEALKPLFPKSQETTQSEGHSRHSGHGIEKADGATPSGRASRFENAAEERKKAEEDEVLQPRIEGQT